MATQLRQLQQRQASRACLQPQQLLESAPVQLEQWREQEWVQRLTLSQQLLWCCCRSGRAMVSQLDWRLLRILPSARRLQSGSHHLDGAMKTDELQMRAWAP